MSLEFTAYYKPNPLLGQQNVPVRQLTLAGLNECHPQRYAPISFITMLGPFSWCLVLLFDLVYLPVYLMTWLTQTGLFIWAQHKGKNGIHAQ